MFTYTSFNDDITNKLCWELIGIWEYLIARLTVLLVLCFSTLLVVIYPVINKHNKVYSKISLVVGLFVFVVLLYFLFGDPVIRQQILKYGFK